MEVFRNVGFFVLQIQPLGTAVAWSVHIHTPGKSHYPRGQVFNMFTMVSNSLHTGVFPKSYKSYKHVRIHFGLNIFISPQLGNNYTTIQPLLWGLQPNTYTIVYISTTIMTFKVNSSHYAQYDKLVYTNQLLLTTCAIIVHFQYAEII